MNHYTSISIFNCRNCDKPLKRGEKEMAEKTGSGECAECQYRLFSNTWTIEKYNAWLSATKVKTLTEN